MSGLVAKEGIAVPRDGKILLAAIVIALLVVFAVGFAIAQQVQGRGRRMGRGMMGPPMVRPFGPPAPAEPVAIAVYKGKVFIASGGKLYRFDAETLEKEMETTYAEAPQPPGPPPPAPPLQAPPAPGAQPGAAPAPPPPPPPQ